MLLCQTIWIQLKAVWTHADEDTYIAVCPLMILPPTPAYRSLSAGLSTPLKFSNRYKGDIKAATFSMQQAEVQYQQVVVTDGAYLLSSEFILKKGASKMHDH